MKKKKNVIKYCLTKLIFSASHFRTLFIKYLMKKILMNAEDIQKKINFEFPDNNLIIEKCDYRSARVILEVNHTHLRPGGTVSGPAIMLLADMAMYTAILTTIGEVFLAVTTNLNINFLRKPKHDKNLVGESTLMKLGKRLIVGEVKIHSQGNSEPVAHATCTYSIPTKSYPS